MLQTVFSISGPSNIVLQVEAYIAPTSLHHCHKRAAFDPINTQPLPIVVYYQQLYKHLWCGSSQLLYQGDLKKEMVAAAKVLPLQDTGFSTEDKFRLKRHSFF
jgi:hypothetical protein